MKKIRTYIIKSKILARGGMIAIIVLLLQLQSFAAHRICSNDNDQLKISAKEYNIVSTPLTSIKVEMAAPEFFFIEEIVFNFEHNDTPSIDYSFISKRYFFDLFRVITPSNAP